MRRVAAGRPAAGGGRWVQVAPERLERWIAGFGERHGGVVRVEAGTGGDAASVSFIETDPDSAATNETDPDGAAEAVEADPDGDADETDPDGGSDAGETGPGGTDAEDTPAVGGVGDAATGPGGVLVLEAADGSVAVFEAAPGMAALPDGTPEAFVAAAGAYRRIGLLLARKATVGIGVAVGPDLVVSKVDSHYVQSRTAAGGWSQQRFARRRDNQAKAAAGDAADIAVRLLLPEAPTLDALVTGGDRRTVETILADRRLAPLLPLVAGRFLDVPDPRQAVLVAAVAQAREIRIRLIDPA